jgi:hypothetical protein
MKWSFTVYVPAAAARDRPVKKIGIEIAIESSITFHLTACPYKSVHIGRCDSVFAGDDLTGINSGLLYSNARREIR